MIRPLLFPLILIWRVYYFAVFIVLFLLLFPVFFVVLLNEKTFYIAFALKRFVAISSRILAGVYVSVERESKLDQNQSYIYCSNHTSYLDIELMSSMFPRYFVFMAKAELRSVPLFRLFFKDMDIAVDRGSKMASHKAFERAGLDIDKGHSVVMFPEGTISDNVPEIGRFKNGPFKLAIEKQIPIVPITFKNNYKIMPKKIWSIDCGGPGIAKVIVHNPISTTGMTEDNVVSLREEVFNTINNTLSGYEHRQSNG